MPKNRTSASATWKAKPKVVLRTPTKRSHSGESTNNDSRITLDRTVYRNKLVRELSNLCDELTTKTWLALNLQFLHLKDQVYGLTVGQLEELIYAFTILNTTQHSLSREVSVRLRLRHQARLKYLQKGLVLE